MKEFICRFASSAKEKLCDFGVVISLFTYTLLVMASTWAAFNFLFKDSEIAQAKSETTTIRSSLEQYQSKASLLQKEIDTIRAENAEYRAWLEKTKDPLPLIVPQLVELKNQVALLSRQPAPNNEQPTEPHTSQNSDSSLKDVDSGIEVPRGFTTPRSSRVGSANHDETTGLIVATAEVDQKRTAKLRITAPGEDEQKIYTVNAGTKINIPWGKRKIQLTVLEVNWYTDSVIYEMRVVAF